METSQFRPILFSTPMVQAILEGRKTQTRRIVKKKYSNTDLVWHEMHSGKTKILVELQNDTPAPRKNSNGTTTHTLKAYKEVKCPYNVGDVLWVRETTTVIKSLETGLSYILPKASFESYKDKLIQGEKVKWKPSIFMPKSACRIFLKIKSIREERLQDISEEDAKAEGVISFFNAIFQETRFKDYMISHSECREASRSFCSLWESINGLNSWNQNPFVFVYEFEQIEKPLDFLV